MILIVGISLGFILIIVMTVTVATSYLFRSRDFDLLMSLPVPTSAIVASKIAHMLLLNYLLFLSYIARQSSFISFIMKPV